LKLEQVFYKSYNSTKNALTKIARTRFFLKDSFFFLAFFVAELQDLLTARLGNRAGLFSRPWDEIFFRTARTLRRTIVVQTRTLNQKKSALKFRARALERGLRAQKQLRNDYQEVL